MSSPIVEGCHLVRLFLDIQLELQLLLALPANMTFLAMMFATGWSGRQRKATDPVEDEIWREELRRRITGDNGDDTMNESENTDLVIKPVPDAMREKTIIANGLVFEGELEAQEDILVRGRVEGNIAAEGHEVRIAREAYIEGEVLANRLLIEGTVSGTVTAEEKVILEEAAEVKGEVHSPKLALEEGCKFNGSVEMG